MGMRFSILPHQDMSKPTDEQVQQVAEHEDRIFMDSMREFDKMQQRNMQRLLEKLESDPKLRAQHEAACRYDHEQKFGHMDFSKLEERVSGTFEHSSGIVRGVVHRYPRMSDNLPRDGRIKIDAAPGKRMLQTDIHCGNVETSDLSEALLQTMVHSFGLRPEQMQAQEQLKEDEHILPFVDEAPFIHNATHMPLTYMESKTGPRGCPTGPVGTSGRALRIDPSKGLGRIEGCSMWSAEDRDRAATPASVRKKLRAKTRAQKKARRKQR